MCKPTPEYYLALFPGSSHSERKEWEGPGYEARVLPSLIPRPRVYISMAHELSQREVCIDTRVLDFFGILFGVY